MKNYVFAGLVFLVIASGSAQAEENQVWTSLAVKGPVQEGGKFLVWFDGHARSRNDVDNLGVTIFRPGIGWRASEKVDLWTGYARVVGRRDNAPNAEEDRFWQQATYSIGILGAGKVTGRTRLEQRFRDTGDDTGWRLRQSIGYAQPLAGNSDMSLVLSNEVFLALNETDWGQRDGYDQNRTFLGVRFKHTANVSTTIGYLNNHLDLGPAGDQTNHNLSMGISVGL